MLKAEKLAEFSGNGIEALVWKIETGFSVQIMDPESGGTVGVIIYEKPEAAMSYARRCAGMKGNR